MKFSKGRVKRKLCGDRGMDALANPAVVSSCLVKSYWGSPRQSLPSRWLIWIPFYVHFPSSPPEARVLFFLCSQRSWDRYAFSESYLRKCYRTQKGKVKIINGVNVQHKDFCILEFSENREKLDIGHWGCDNYSLTVSWLTSIAIPSSVPPFPAPVCTW